MKTKEVELEETCSNCAKGETCNKNSNRIHCNLFDRSFDRDAWCDNYEREYSKKD